MQHLHGCRSPLPLRLGSPQLLYRRPIATALGSQHEKDAQELNEFFPVIVNTVKTLTKVCKMPAVSEWLIKVLEYNGCGRRWPGGLSTLNAMRELCSSSPGVSDPNSAFNSKFLAWCVELDHISYQLSDGLVEGLEQRWGRPSWHTVPGVNQNATNDSGLVRGLVFQLLRFQFGGAPCYVELTDLFRKNAYHTAMGMICDAQSLSDGRARIHSFSTQKYATFVRLKTTEGTFFLPLAAALLASGVQDPVKLQVAHEIACDIGLILQSENEFKDCYEVANTEQCSDIRNGRCTWLIVEGKRRANKKQMNILEENYGFNDQRKVDEVLNVYNELGLKEAFLESNQAAYGRVLAKIHQNAETISPSVFTYVLESLKLFDGREILFRCYPWH